MYMRRVTSSPATLFSLSFSLFLISSSHTILLSSSVLCLLFFSLDNDCLIFKNINNATRAWPSRVTFRFNALLSPNRFVCLHHRCLLTWPSTQSTRRLPKITPTPASQTLALCGKDTQSTPSGSSSIGRTTWSLFATRTPPRFFRPPIRTKRSQRSACTLRIPSP